MITKSLTRQAPFITFISVILTSLLYIGSPYIFGDEFVRLRAGEGNIDVILPGTFETCKLTFRNQINVDWYYLKVDKKVEKGEAEEIKKTEIQQVLTNVNLENMFRPNDIGGARLKARITYNSQYPVELLSVEIDGNKQNLRDFFNSNIDVRDKEFINSKFIRDDISLGVLKYNDIVGNIVLVPMTIYLLPLFFKLIRNMSALWVQSDKTYRKKIMLKYSLINRYNEEDVRNAQYAFGEEHDRDDNWLRFLQILGPAIGYLLTVSSLIAALHPLVRETQDFAIFLGAVQVAMVSTLIGLSMRIIALYLQRVNNKLLIRTDEQFEYLKSHAEPVDSKT